MMGWLRGANAARWLAVAAGATLAAAIAVSVVALTRGSDPGVARVETAPATTAGATPSSTSAPSPAPTPIRHAGILDGVAMSDEEWEARKDLLPVAVMVDNSPSAYPMAGLDKADLIYEAFVEGGITRFMAVFWRRDAARIEPVRSARTPFVIWADELGALYAHAGGASTDSGANAVGQIYEWRIKDLNAFGSGADSKYYRDQERYAPYNLVAGTAPLREAAGGLGYVGPAEVQPWQFKATGEGTSAATTVLAFEVDFEERRLPSRVIQWRWDAASNSYLRFQSGGPHLDAVTKEQLHFTNVVVMRVPWNVVDEAGHVLLEQFGQGQASIFMDGRKVEATWKKADRKARTRFYDAFGAEMAFNRGPIFIEVLGPASLLMVSETVDGLPPLPEYSPPPPDALPPEPAAEEPTPSATPAPARSSSPSPTASVTPTAGTPAPSRTPGPMGSSTTAPSPSPSRTPATGSSPAASPTLG